jgi:hypothetical protein
MRQLLLVVGLVVGAAVLFAPGASAHDTRKVGDLAVSVGWRDEPAFAGLPNAAEITAVDDRGTPVVDLKASLSATISFGDATVVKPLLPREPGVYAAEVVPTQPGTYSFHVAGTLDGQTVDIDSTCSDTTFECVADASEVEFPAPGGAETAAAPARAAQHGDDGSAPTILAIVALTLSTVAVVATVTMATRSRRAERSA